MSFNPVQIHPIDLKDSVAVGVNLPFTSPSVFQSNYQTKDALKNNLINFFLTNPGERLLNPTFGGGLRAFIFEQIRANNLEFLKEDIETKIINYFPQIIINELNVSGNDKTVNVVLKYSIKNTNTSDGLEMNFTP
jgi:phage baseplate assembly protein W